MRSSMGASTSIGLPSNSSRLGFFLPPFSANMFSCTNLSSSIASLPRLEGNAAIHSIGFHSGLVGLVSTFLRFWNSRVDMTLKLVAFFVASVAPFETLFVEGIRCNETDETHPSCSTAIESR